MHVEDIFLKIRDRLFDKKSQLKSLFKGDSKPFNGALDDDWIKSFVESVGSHIDMGKALSTRQSEMILKIIRKVKPYVAENLDSVIENPTYRLPLYKSTFVPKEVRYIGGNLLAFRFKYNPELFKRLQKICDVKKASWFTDDIYVDMESYRNITPKSYFDQKYNIWIVPVYRYNLQPILALITEERFGKDIDVEDYLRLVQKSIDKPSIFYIDTEFDVIRANVCDNPLLACWITEIAEGIPL